MRLSSSIALCTYNGEKYLQEQLDSLAAQTRLPDELVVCDDCSTDNTVQIVMNFAKTAPFPVLLFINDTKLGFIRNFEKAMQKSTKDIIFFCDQDDIWNSQKIQKFIDIFNQEPDTGLVFSDAELVDSENQSLHQLLSRRNNIVSSNIECEVRNDFWRFCLKNYIVWTGMCIAFRRVFLDSLLPFSDSVFHDLWCVRILSALTEARFIPEPLVRYRIHHNNASGSEVPVRTIAWNVNQARNPGIAQYYAEVAQAMLELSERLVCISDKVRFPEAGKYFRVKGKHYQVRYEIHTKKKTKVLTILQETLNLRYFRYSRGWRSIVSDLLS